VRGIRSSISFEQKGVPIKEKKKGDAGVLVNTFFHRPAELIRSSVQLSEEMIFKHF